MDRITLTLGTAHFQDANEHVRKALSESDTVVLENVLAQRYLGCAMESGKRLEIHGVPGNDMACYMDGGSIEVFGNAQDQIGNTMNDGEIVVHGRCGDATGYGMRGGKVFIRDGCGWRVGIHMKQYKDKRAAIVIGGDAGAFLGEYMAGGVILLMGQAGNYLATGMHGGVIYLKNAMKEEDIPEGLIFEPVSEEDKVVVHQLLAEYNQHFQDDLGSKVDDSGEGFYCLRPASSRPYAAMYA